MTNLLSDPAFLTLKKRKTPNLKAHTTIKINTIKLKGKIKMVKNKKASKPGFKKAIITLKKGQSIDLATGV